MNLEQQINDLNRRYERAKDTRKRAEWRMEELEKEDQITGFRSRIVGI